MSINLNNINIFNNVLITFFKVVAVAGVAGLTIGACYSLFLQGFAWQPILLGFGGTILEILLLVAFF